MTQIKPYPDESIESALKRFKKKVDNAGIISEVKSRKQYEKPSDKKRRLKKKSMARVRKKLAKIKRKIERESTTKFRPRKNFKRRDDKNISTQEKTQQSKTTEPKKD